MSAVEEKKTSQKTKSSCNICCENRSTFVKCLYCNFEACSDCTQKYLLENIDAKCMGCSKGWSLEFIQTNFSHTFVHKKYKAHRENILLEKEKALLPQTQMILENKKKVKDMNSQIAKYRELIYNLEQEVLFLNGNQNVYKKRQEKIINCIANDCRGFLTPHGQHTLQCGICNITVCKSCRERREEKENKENKENKEEKEDDHKCDPQLVESIKAIEKECKPCPKCGSYIYKISGCFDRNTEILLYDGTIKTAENIKVGDVLVGDDGNPRKVLELVSGEDKMYKIKQNNGVEYIVNSKHELVLFCKNNVEIKHIVVEDFINNKDNKYDNYYGIKLNEIKTDQQLEESSFTTTSIQVEFVGIDKYYGWKVDGNTRFILPDFTVVKNCDQLWCTQCRTAFSWRTGQVETGVVHNPHYWEYIRQHGNEDDEVRRQFGNVGNNEQNNDANELLNLNECDFRFENLVSNRDFMLRIDAFREEITELLREISHCQRYEIPRARVDIHDPKNNEDIRVKYLENEIDEKKFKMTIQRRQKLNEFKTELVQILETFVTVYRESTIRYYRLIMELRNFRDQKGKESIKGLVKQWVTDIRQVRDFTVSSIEKLCDRFNYTFNNLLRDHFNSYVRLTDMVFRKLDTQDQNEKKKIEERKREEDKVVNGIFSRGFKTYSEEMREVMKEKFQDKSGTEIAKELFNLWRNTPIDVKTYYKELELHDEKQKNKEEEKKEVSVKRETYSDNSDDSESDDEVPLSQRLKKQ